MSEKSLYKKLVNIWFDDDKTQQRARENQFFEKVNADKVGAKSKSKAKPNPRADHKHEYVPVVIWSKSWDNEVYGRVGERCRICGKKKQNYYSFCRGNELRKYHGDMEHFWQENDKLTPIDKDTYRETIFWGGSQTVKALTVEVKNKLIDYMNLGHKFVIGDCKGADLEMQKFFAENGYKDVVVYYSGDRARINLSCWEEKKIATGKFAQGYELYKKKDEQMAIVADEGFMVLKGATRGTMANIERLVSLKKDCFVAFFIKNETIKRPNIPDYDIRLIRRAEDFVWLKKYYAG